MKENFLDFNLSMELKLLGFDKDCLAGYNEHKNLITPRTKNAFVPYYGKYCGQNKHIIKAPLIQQCFEFFRDEYNYIGNVIFDKDCFKFQYGYMKGGLNLYTTKYKTYRDAEIACIKQMIETCKQNKQ